MAKKLRALGGNIFAGLFTVGVKRAGFEVTGHLEHGPYGVATAVLNHPELKDRVWTHPTQWPAPSTFGKINFMFCNPPCAAWSSARASKKDSWEDHHDRMRIIEHLTTYGIELGPDAWVWESVTNAWRHGRGMIDRVAEAWLDAGYHVTVIKQNNMYLGVPQNRPRILVVAHKYPLVFPPLQPTISVGTALKGIRSPKADLAQAHRPQYGWGGLWEAAGDGTGNMRRVYQTYDTTQLKTVKTSPSFMTRRLFSDRPSPVMLGQEKQWHPKECRTLTFDEAKALCGLPREWQRSGSITAAFGEMSRAVMPPVGEWLAKAVADGLGKKWPARRPSNDEKPYYQVVHMDAGPDKVYAERLDPEGDRTMGPLQAWHEATPPVVKQRVAKDGTTRTSTPRGQGIGEFMRECLERGDNTELVLRRTHDKFPTSKATAADVSYQRRKLRQLKKG